MMQKTKKIIRNVLLIGLAAILLNFCLFAFQHNANSAPKNLIFSKISQAFKSKTFVPNEYPGYGPPFSHQALLGRVHYTECQLALVAVVDFDSSLRGSILPKAYKRAEKLKRGSFAHCQDLHKYINNPTSGAFILAEKRSRYMWGSAALMGNALRYMSVFQMKEFLKKTTTLSILLLAISLTILSRQFFLLLSPLLASTVMFSGTSFFSDIAFGAPFLVSILGPTILCLSWITSKNSIVPMFCAAICGGVSSFFWLIDGHTLQFVTWIILVSYFALIQRGNNQLASFVGTIKAVVFYGVGFLSTYAVNQLIKSYYLGFDEVWRTFINHVRLRSSDSTINEVNIDYVALLTKLWQNGFEQTAAVGHIGLSNFVFSSSLFALMIGVLVASVRYIKDRRDTELLGVHVLILGIFGYFLLRFFLTQNHSWILPHSHFVGRYLFILVGLCWVSFVAGFIIKFDPERTRDA